MIDANYLRENRVNFQQTELHRCTFIVLRLLGDSATCKPETLTQCLSHSTLKSPFVRLLPVLVRLLRYDTLPLDQPVPVQKLRQQLSSDNRSTARRYGSNYSTGLPGSGGDIHIWTSRRFWSYRNTSSCFSAAA